jgi:HK97 family phage prohead protease
VADEQLGTRPVSRAYAVDDLHVRSDGSGRTVEAYAAVFNTRTEVIDQDGHYHEELAPGSFTTTIATRGLNFGVLFNHGLTIDGAPNPSATMPIGVPLEVRADNRGVFTATRYLDNPLADQVLDAIRQGAVRAQSFSGRFRKSVRSYPNGRARSALPLITRHEVEMREYGPAVFAAYEGASILGTRAEQFMRALLAMPPDRALEFLQKFEGFTTADRQPGPLTSGTSSEVAAAGIDSTSDRPLSPLGARIRAARIARGMES